jgi:hypothetical protein
MACECQAVLRASCGSDSALSPVLQPEHLLWMCREVARHAKHWPLAKLHRWIGFVQAGLLANHVLTLDEITRIFDDSQAAHGAPTDDYDLIDHLDAVQTL